VERDPPVARDKKDGARQAFGFNIGLEYAAIGFEALGGEAGIFGAAGNGKRLSECGGAQSRGKNGDSQIRAKHWISLHLAPAQCERRANSFADQENTLEHRVHVFEIEVYLMADDIRTYEPAGYAPGFVSRDILLRISWSAVWAGVVIALGMEVLFALFGFSIGFGMYHWQAASPWGGIAAWSTIWYLVTAGWSMFFGAWCAARLSGNPLAGDSILHGISTWGLATFGTVLLVAAGSWALLREGIAVLSTQMLAAGQTGAMMVVPPGTNPGPTAQATANILSSLAFQIFIGVFIGFITSIVGGLLGRSRPVAVTVPDVAPVPIRRAA
jgi:hypothetical protein